MSGVGMWVRWALVASAAVWLCPVHGGPEGEEAAAVNFPQRSGLMEVLRDLRASTMVELLERTGLSEVLRASGPYTVLAPSDDAWERLPRAARRRLQAQPSLLTHLLMAHVAPGRMPSRSIQDHHKMRTLGNRTLTFRIFADRKPSVNHVTLTLMDATATNGVVHVVGDVIFPLPADDVLKALDECGQFQLLRKYIREAGLEEKLSDPDVSMTLLAPTDEAFRLVPPETAKELFRTDDTTDLNNATSLTRTLLHHLVMGSHFSPALRDSQLLLSAADTDLDVGVRNNRLREVGVARVLKSDLPAANGVVHIIDRVLRPDDIC